MDIIKIKMDSVQVAVLRDNFETVDGGPVEQTGRIEPTAIPGAVFGKFIKGNLHMPPLAVPSGDILINLIPHPLGMVIGIIGFRIDKSNVNSCIMFGTANPKINCIIIIDQN